MKNAFLKSLIFGLMICGSANAQYPDELMKADSLIQQQDYNNALSVINHVIEQNPTRFLLSHANFQLGQIFLGMDNLEKAIYYNQRSLAIRNDLQYEFIGDNYMLFGLIEMQRGNNDKALGYFFKAIELPYESLEFGGLLYAYIAQVYYRKNELENVVKHYKIAMQTWMTAFEDANVLDLNHYRIRRNRLFYDQFFVGFL
jgi:tetratricopeptide (TPR) repeat protein